MKSALTRLPLLLGASLALCVWSGGGLALAAKHKRQPTHTTAKHRRDPTNPAQYQYVETVPTITGHKGRKPKPSTTPTTPSTPSSGPRTGSGGATTPGVTTPRHHRRAHRGTKKSRPSKTMTDLHRATHLRGSKRGRSATGLTVAAATGSGGGLGVWLLVILILVLLTGSVVGIIRYRRTH